jgi:hypothetical protein
LETCARNHENEKENFKSNWNSYDQSRAAKKTWQAPWYEVRLALAASATPARAFQQQRGAVAAACFDLIALYLTTSIPRLCNMVEFDRVRQAHFWQTYCSKTEEIKVM